MNKNRKSKAPIPESILQLQRELEQFRSTQPSRTKLPETLWQAAVELARQYGVYSVAHPLRLDYMGLKKRLGEVPNHRQKAAGPAFVEMVVPRPTTREGCLIEVESARGDKMRIQWKADEPLDWANLLCAWRKAER